MTYVNGLMQGDYRAYCAVESVDYEDKWGEAFCHVGFLNSLSPSGLPSHRPDLKIKTTVMLIRSLNARQWLVNGMRVIVKTPIRALHSSGSYWLYKNYS